HAAPPGTVVPAADSYRAGCSGGGVHVPSNRDKGVSCLHPEAQRGIPVATKMKRNWKNRVIASVVRGYRQFSVPKILSHRRSRCLQLNNFWDLPFCFWQLWHLW